MFEDKSTREGLGGCIVTVTIRSFSKCVGFCHGLEFGKLDNFILSVYLDSSSLACMDGCVHEARMWGHVSL